MITKNFLNPESGEYPWGSIKLSAKYWETYTFADGTRIFHEGDEANALFLIEEGTVRIELERAELDSESVLAQIGPGEFFGEQSLLDGGSRSASAFADGPVTLRRLSAQSLNQLENEDPQTAVVVYRTLGHAVSMKLRESNEQFSNAVFSPRDAYVEEVVTTAIAAQEFLAQLDEATLDPAIAAIAMAVAKEAEPLARMTVEVTKMGRIEDKVLKNQFASVGVATAMAGAVGTGVLDREAELAGEVVEIGAAAGVVFGLIPVTNPVATAIFKLLACLKARNAIILSFPRSAAALGQRFSELVAPILESVGIPSGVLHCVTKRSSRRMTEAFFRHPGVNLILATGGRSMVESAYRSGKPALGVGPGNAPALVCHDADVRDAAAKIVASKTFDNGLICGSEHNLIAVATVKDDFVQALEHFGTAVLNADEAARFRSVAIVDDGSTLRRKFQGKPASEIAEAAGIKRSDVVRLIVVPGSAEQIVSGDFVGGEKMAPVLGLFVVASDEEGIALARQLLEREGKGHTAVIHTADRQRALDFAAAVPASRLLVNSPATQGVIGQTSALEPSLVLGCGYFGGNSTGDNVNYRHLRNIKRLAFFKTPKDTP